jgi:hypothetical protein
LGVRELVAHVHKPHLVRFFEAVAAILELDLGRCVLELRYRDGRLGGSSETL